MMSPELASAIDARAIQVREMELAKLHRQLADAKRENEQLRLAANDLAEENRSLRNQLDAADDSMGVLADMLEASCT